MDDQPITFDLRTISDGVQMLVGAKARERLGDRFAGVGGVTPELRHRRGSDEAVRVRELRQPKRNLERVSGKLIVGVHLAEPSGDPIAPDCHAAPRGSGEWTWISRIALTLSWNSPILTRVSAVCW